MKASRLLAQVYSVTGEEKLKELARKSAAFVMNHQRKDGAWIYSTSKAGTWIDNYHTGYVLDCLKSYTEYCCDESFLPHYEKGLAFYKSNFFSEEGMPAFYYSHPYPLDCTAAAQSVLTLINNQERALALKVARFTIRNMQSPKGNFYFRKYKYHTEKTAFMRWSDAWMFAALASVAPYE
jgi:hypothetical protein